MSLINENFKYKNQKIHYLERIELQCFYKRVKKTIFKTSQRKFKSKY